MAQAVLADTARGATIIFRVAQALQSWWAQNAVEGTLEASLRTAPTQSAHGSLPISVRGKVGVAPIMRVAERIVHWLATAA